MTSSLIKITGGGPESIFSCQGGSEVKCLRTTAVNPSLGHCVFYLISDIVSIQRNGICISQRAPYVVPRSLRAGVCYTSYQEEILYVEEQLWGASE
jgi:hypothetical protein